MTGSLTRASADPNTGGFARRPDAGGCLPRHTEAGLAASSTVHLWPGFFLYRGHPKVRLRHASLARAAPVDGLISVRHDSQGWWLLRCAPTVLGVRDAVALRSMARVGSAYRNG